VAAQRTGLALDAALPSSSHLQVPTRDAEPPPSEPPTPRVGPTHHATPTRGDKAPKSRGRPWRAGDGGGRRACRKVNRSRTIDLPITSQMLSVGLDGTSRIVLDHVGRPFGPNGSWRRQPERLDDRPDDQAPSYGIGWQGKPDSLGPGHDWRRSSCSLLFRRCEPTVRPSRSSAVLAGRVGC
jgi:hypothetical protein